MFTFLFYLSRRIPGFSKLLRLFFNCDIPKRAKIGSRVTFNHCAMGVVLHPNCVIEDDVWIEHHVCLGQRTETDTSAPIVKKDCVIGAYAIILGGVTIGEGSVIGAGAIITHDVPAHSIVYCKQEIVLKENSKKRGQY